MGTGTFRFRVLSGALSLAIHWAAGLSVGPEWNGIVARSRYGGEGGSRASCFSTSVLIEGHSRWSWTGRHLFGQ
jgi:hypothetical protein